MHAFADFLQRLRGARAFVFRADAGGEITVEGRSGQKRGVAIDMLALKGLKLGHAHRVLMDDAGEIHEFGKTDDLRVMSERQELFDRQIGP